MKQMFLISWNDDNHDPHYWLNTEYLGVDIITIAENLFGLGQEIGAIAVEFKEVDINADSFPNTIWEQLFDYFQTVLTLDETDVRLIVAEEWEKFFDKNILKSIDKQK